MPWNEIGHEKNVQFNLRLGITVRRCSIFECLSVVHFFVFVCSRSYKLFGWQWLFVVVTNNPIQRFKIWSKTPPQVFQDALEGFSVDNPVVVQIRDDPQLNM